MTASDKVKKYVRAAVKKLKIPLSRLDTECCNRGYTGLVMFLRRDGSDIGVNKVEAIKKAIAVLERKAKK